MNLKNSIDESEPCVLVEGPAWADADFYGKWLPKMRLLRSHCSLSIPGIPGRKKRPDKRPTFAKSERR